MNSDTPMRAIHHWTRPMGTPHNAGVHSAQLLPAPGRGRQRVLLVDDDLEIRASLTLLLERDGWQVETADNGAVALERLSRHLPDVVLLDLSMPRLDGWSVLARRAVEPTWAGVPFIAMSADTRQAEAVLELGAALFLAKPFGLARLRAALRQVLGPAGSG